MHSRTIKINFLKDTIFKHLEQIIRVEQKNV